MTERLEHVLALALYAGGVVAWAWLYLRGVLYVIEKQTRGGQK